MNIFKPLSVLFIFLAVFADAKSQMKIGSNPTTINSASLLELESINKGFVLPRVLLVSTASTLPLPSGLLTGTTVYNTNALVTNGNGVGIYVWNGSAWISVSPNISTSAWALVGNSNISTSNFIGTTNAVDIIAKTNNTERLRITSAGNIGIGLSNPGNALSILSSSNPLYLSGVQPTSTFTTDSVLTINAGIVKKAPYLTIAGISWNLTGNSGTSPSTAAIGSTINNNFIGTIDSKDLVLATNNFERMRLTSGGYLGIGTASPENSLHVVGITSSGPTPSNVVTIETINTNSTQTSNPAQWSNVRQIPTSVYSANNNVVSGVINFGYRVPGSSTYNSATQIQCGSMNSNGIIGFTTRTGMTNGNPSGGTLTGGITVSPGITYNMVLNGTILGVANLLGGATTLSTDANGNIIRTPSDIKLKTNIRTIDSALSKVMKLHGVTYNWKDTLRFGSQKEIGFIAQQIEKIVPEVVRNGGEYKSVNYQVLTALLANAMQEQQQQIDSLNTQNKQLMQMIENQQASIILLQKQMQALEKKTIN